jgi:hypothetical protein
MKRANRSVFDGPETPSILGLLKDCVPTGQQMQRQFEKHQQQVMREAEARERLVDDDQQSCVPSPFCPLNLRSPALILCWFLDYSLVSVGNTLRKDWGGGGGRDAER